ncbi:MAG: hypothetical protein AAF799_13255 [Myxococcota bacterium]
MAITSPLRGRLSAPAALLMAGVMGSACGGDDVVGGSGGGTSGGTAADGSDGADSTAAPSCDDFVQDCDCPDGGQGLQFCDPATGEFGACEQCPMPTCGDNVCDPGSGEDCESCVEDCGECMQCADAPSCDTATIPGKIDAHFETLDILPEKESVGPGPLAQQLAAKAEAGDVGMRIVAAALDSTPMAGEHPFVPKLREVFAAHPEAASAVRHRLADAGMGTAAQYRTRFPDPRHSAAFEPGIVDSPVAAPGDCNDPLLRIRLASIMVHDEADLIFKDQIYCAIIAEATPGAEIRVTPKTFALDNGDEYTYALAEGVVWGQLGEPVAPQGNLAMTYNCLEGDDTGAFEAFLMAIADAAAGVGALPGTYGWILPVIGAAADIIAAALALENDDHLFNASQVIPAELQLDLTHGGWWSVQRTGTFMLKDWHWELRMEAWGCTEPGETP